MTTGDHTHTRPLVNWCQYWQALSARSTEPAPWWAVMAAKPTKTGRSYGRTTQPPKRTSRPTKPAKHTMKSIQPLILFVHDHGSQCRFSVAADGTITEVDSGGIDAAQVLRRGKADLTGTPEEIRAEVERVFRDGPGCAGYVATID